MDSSNDKNIETVAKLLKTSQKVLFITGAGISADSGLPTYRGTGGLYADNSTEDGVSIENALSASMFASKPEITWKYLLQIARACIDAQPNAAHLAIAEFLRCHTSSYVLTQNIDGLHGQCPESQLIEIHGNAFNFYCVSCAKSVEADSRTFLQSISTTPSCQYCGGLVRPSVVLFEEALPGAALQRLSNVLQAEPDLVVSIGTSALFPYIIEPVYRAKASGIATVEINPDTTEISSQFDYRIALGAAQAMQVLL